MKKVLVGLLLVTVTATAWAVNYFHKKDSKEVSVTTTLKVGSMLWKDTVYVGGENLARFKAITYAARVGAAYSTARGFGGVDTARVAVATLLADSIWQTIDSQQATSIPAFFQKSIVSNDTLIKSGGLRIIFYLSDSVTDTAMTTKYPTSWDVTLKD